MTQTEQDTFTEGGVAAWYLRKRLLQHLCFILFTSVLIFVAHPGTASAPPQPAQLRTYFRQGIEKAFNLDTQGATGIFQRAVELDRENPLGYALLAMAHMFAYEMNFDPNERAQEQESMLLDVDEALSRGQKRIEKSDRNGQVYFAMTLAKIVKIRWAIAQKSYFMTMHETAAIWDYLEKAKAEDPQNFDVYFSMGLLHYHLAHLSAAARFFSSLFITAGNREKGLQELELAAQKGDLLKELAQAELVSVYGSFEEQPTKALPIARELKEKFPRNYNFAFALANIYSELHRFTEAFAIAGEIERGIQAGRPPFAPQLLPRYHHLMGRILFNQGEYARAEEFFRKALVDVSAYNARTRVSAFVRLGMIRDIRREREKAEEYYSRALEVEGGEGFARAEAEKYLATPYAPRARVPIP
jgi:tetratricopeptide (TPR) repeat protein